MKCKCNLSIKREHHIHTIPDTYMFLIVRIVKLFQINKNICNIISGRVRLVVISVSGSRLKLLLPMYNTCDYVCRHLSDPAADDDDDAPVPADNQIYY